MPTVDPDAIGIIYRIDLAKLNASIIAASTKLGEFNKKIESLGKQASAKMNVAANSVKNIATASETASEQLKKMGISANTTAAEIKAMNLSAVEVSAALKLTKDRMQELTNQTAKAGTATKASKQEFRRLEERMPGLRHEANKGVKAFGDYRRAMDRWGAGFKFMILSQAAWIASGAILFGTLSAITNAIKNFVDFHQDLRDAAAIVQATTAGYEKMEKAAVKAFLNSTLSLRETTKALKILGQTGLEAAEAAIVLETAYKIAVGTGGDMTTVVKFLTTAMAVWRIEAEDSIKVGNVLGAALNFSKLEVEDLGTAFNFVASMAKSVGLSATDLASILAVMSNAGVKASTMATGLRGIFAKLLAPTPKLAKELAKVGLSMKDVSLIGNDFFTVLKNLEKAGFDLTNIFGGFRRRAGSSLNVLLEQGTERLGLMREALTNTNSVSVLFEKSMEGMKNQMVLAGHAIQQFLIGGLSPFKPIITGTAIVIRELFVALDTLRPIILSAAIAWGVIAGAQVAATHTTYALTAALWRAVGVLKTFATSHPILLGLTILVGGFMAIKTSVDALNVSMDEQKSRLNRRIDDMKKLQIIMMDSNRTDEEKLEIMEEFVKDYPELLDALQSHKITIEGIIDATKRLISVDKEGKKALDERMLAQLEADLKGLAARKKLMEKIGAGDTVYDTSGLTINFTKEIEKTEKEILRLKIKLGRIFVGTVPVEDDKKPDFKWMKELKERLAKLRENAKTDREKAQSELDAGLAKFKNVKGLEQDVEENVLEVRGRLWQEYREKIKKINDDEQKDRDRITAKNAARLKKEQDALDRFADKQVKASLKEAARLLKEFARAEKQEKSFRSKISKFREGLSDDEAKLVKNDFERKQLFLDKEIKERRRKYNELLEDTKDYYATLSKLAEDNELLVPEKEKIKKMTEAIEAMVAGLEKIETRERKDLAGRDPSNFTGGIEEGLRQARETLSDEYTIWKNLTNNVALAMRDSFSDLFFDGMKGELRSLSDFFNSFGNAVKRQIADMASAWVTSGLFGTSPGGGLFGSVIGAVGNLFNPSPSTGGAELGALSFDRGGPNLKRGRSLAILEENEFMIKPASARSIGTNALNFANRTGRLPSTGGNTTHVHNSVTIVAMDSESMDQALRRGGARAIQDISVGSFLNERERNPRFGVR